MEEEVNTNSLSSWSTVFLIILENLDAFHIVFPDKKNQSKSNKYVAQSAQNPAKLDLVSVAPAREITNAQKQC